jgi:hypothetical protein
MWHRNNISKNLKKNFIPKLAKYKEKEHVTAKITLRPQFLFNCNSLRDEPPQLDALKCA